MWFVSFDWPILGAASQCSPTFVLLSGSFYLASRFQGSCMLWQLFCGSLLFCCVSPTSCLSVPRVVSTLLAVVNTTAVKLVVQVTVRVPAFTSFGYIPRNTVAGSYGNTVLRFWGNYPPVFHSGCTTVHSHPQCMRVSIFLHPCPH